jgi:A/G-specific adenine glycosylase
MSDAAIAAALLDWYRQGARDLPWRRTRDPYAIWVSEIMLQQTRVETVIPYWERFVERWPSVEDLAAAELDDVLTAWSGLGYYRRARQLHQAASEVVERYDGRLPGDARELLTLTGIGRYTAGAIASIAHGKREAVVDGNVIRVLSRLFALEDDMRASRGQKKVWALAEQLVPESSPGDFNQALMELGATVCLPRSPGCERCPVATFCEGRERGLAEALPHLKKKKKPRPVSMVAAVISGKGDRVLLAQRKADGLFGGLWEPPMVEGGGVAEVRPALGERGVRPRSPLRVLGRVEHVLSHRRLNVEVATGRASRRWSLPTQSSGPYQRLAWRRLADEEVALSTLARKILTFAERESRQEALW